MSHALRIVLPSALCLTLVGAAPPRPAGKTWLTYPMPPKVKPVDPLTQEPGIQIPEDPGAFIWKLTPPAGDKKTTTVPVYTFTRQDKRQVIGQLSMGTTVQLSKVRRFGTFHYYAVPFESGEGWISGMYVKAAGYSASVK